VATRGELENRRVPTSKLNIALHVLCIAFILSVCFYGIDNGFPDFHLWKPLFAITVVYSLLVLFLNEHYHNLLSPKLYLILFTIMFIGFSIGAFVRAQTINREAEIITREVMVLLGEVVDLSRSPRFQAVCVDYSCLRLLAAFSFIGMIYTALLVLYRRAKMTSTHVGRNKGVKCNYPQAKPREESEK
jgi:hypothetical protein